MSEAITLVQQNEQVQEALKRVALGTPQVDTLTIEDFDKWIKMISSIRDLKWDERWEIEKRWKAAFFQKQKESPTYVRSLLEYSYPKETEEEKEAEENAKRPLNATPYRKEILDLLLSKDVKENWYCHAAALNIEWTMEDIKRFPLSLVKQYIELERPPQYSRTYSFGTQRILNKVEKNIGDENKELFEELKRVVKTDAEEDFYDYNSEEEDQGHREKRYDMTSKERMFVQIALVWGEALEKEVLREIEEEKYGNEIDWPLALLQTIYQHTDKKNQCPPGNRLQVLRVDAPSAECATTEVEEEDDQNAEEKMNDLAEQIFERYKEDPISALRQTSRRYLLFRYGNIGAKLSQYRRCQSDDHFGIEFPDLCYVFVTDIDIVYHGSCLVAEEDRGETTFRIDTGTSSIPISYQAKKKENGRKFDNKEQHHSCNESTILQKMYTRRIKMTGEEGTSKGGGGEGKLCKWIQVQTNGCLNFVAVHEIRVYGKAVILM